MHFFNTIHNHADIADKSWAGYFESLANGCRAPAQWVSAELCNSGVRKAYEFRNINVMAEYSSDQFQRDSCCLRVARTVIGLIVCSFTYLLSMPLMGLAYTSQEIRLKHALSVRILSVEEEAQLRELVEARQSLQAQRLGCDGGLSAVILGSICCLLCTLVCCK